MYACKYLVFLSIILNNFHLIFSCGCYGSQSCTPTGIFCHQNPDAVDTCLCDCCPACNTCEQLLQLNCFSDRYIKHYSLSKNQSKLTAKINESITEYYIIDQTTGEIARDIWNPCLREILPKNIYLTNHTDGSYQLIGIPKEKLEETSYEIIFKGSVNRIISVHFTITII